jgi:hypothetical protein
MHSSPNWTIRTVFVAVAATLVGFWLPRGVALVAGFFGAKITVSPIDELAAALVCVSFSLIVEQAAMVHQTLDSHRREIVASLESDIHEQLAFGIKELFISAGILTTSRDLGYPAVVTLLRNMGGLLEPIAQLPEPMRSGVATWMSGPLDSYRRSLNELSTIGVIATLSEHVAVSRAMCEAGTKHYITINHFAYDTATQWSREWKDFLFSTKLNSAQQVDYVVLGSKEYFTTNRTKLGSMNAYLKRCNARLLLSDRQLVTDSIGAFVLDRNIELFDTSVVKTQSLSQTGYRGGINLNISISLAEDRPELVRIAKAILACAVPYKVRLQ